MKRLSQFASLLVLPLVIATVGLSSTAHAERDYCDRTDSKAQGTIIGGLGGAGAGALIDDGSAKGILIGGVLGALGGRLIGHSIDAQHDRRDCGIDARPEQRRIQREETRDDRYQSEDDQRNSDINADIARSRYQQDRFGRSRRQRRQPMYQCVSLGRSRYGQRFGVVYTPAQRVIEETGYDAYDCQDRASELNRYGR